MKTITFAVDDLDHDAILEAEGDAGGRLLAEVCRGWLERVESRRGER